MVVFIALYAISENAVNNTDSIFRRGGINTWSRPECIVGPLKREIWPIAFCTITGCVFLFNLTILLRGPCCCIMFGGGDDFVCTAGGVPDSDLHYARSVSFACARLCFSGWRRDSFCGASHSGDHTININVEVKSMTQTYRIIRGSGDIIITTYRDYLNWYFVNVKPRGLQTRYVPSPTGRRFEMAFVLVDDHGNIVS